MAVFNPSPNPTNDPNWLGLSKPISDVPANKTAGMALSLAGNALELGVGAADELIKKGIKDDVYASRDINHDIQVDRLETGNKIVTGDPTPTSVSGTSIAQPNQTLVPNADTKPQEAPPALEQSLNQMGRLGNASKNSPVVNDTFYSMQAESLAKKLRAQYPGYREYIDETISKAFGMPIANAYYKNLMVDLNHAVSQLNSQNKEIDGLYEKNKELPGNAEMVFALKQNPTPENMYKYQSWAGKQAAKIAGVKNESAEIALTAAQGNLDSTTANSAAIRGANSVADLTFNGSIINSPGFKKYAEDAAKGIADPQQGDMVLQNLNAAKAQSEAALRKYYDEPRPELKGKSYAQIIGDPAKVEAAIKSANTRFDPFIQVMNGTKEAGSKATGGLLTLYARQNEQILTGATRDLYEKSPIMPRFQAVISTLSPQLMASTVGQQILRGQNIQEGVRDYFTMESATKFAPRELNLPDPATGQPKKIINANSAAEEISKYKDAKIPSESQVYQEVFKRVNLLNDPSIPEENKRNLLRSLFGLENKGVLNNFESDKPSDKNPYVLQPGKHTAFDILTSAETVRNIERYTKGDAELRTAYLNWAKNSWSDSIVRSDIAAINTIDPKKFYFKWSDGSDGVSRIGFQLIDKATNQPVAPAWVYRQNPDPTKAAMPYVNIDGATTAATSLERLNRTLPNMANMLQTFGDKRPMNEVMISTFGSLGTTFAGQSETSILKGMTDAVVSSQVKPNDTVKSRFVDLGGLGDKNVIDVLSPYFKPSGNPRADPIAQYIDRYVPKAALENLSIPHIPGSSDGSGVREGSIADFLVKTFQKYIPRDQRKGFMEAIRQGDVSVTNPRTDNNAGNNPPSNTLQYTAEPRPRGVLDWMANPTGETPANSLTVPGPIIAPAQTAPQAAPQDEIPVEIANNPYFSHYDPATKRHYMRNTLSQDSINKGLDAKNRALRESKKD